MKSLIPMDDYGVFVDKHDTARVDSRYVAQFFEKEHRAVLRDIRELDCSTAQFCAVGIHQRTGT